MADTEFLKYLYYIEHLKKTFVIFDTQQLNSCIEYSWYFFDKTHKFICIKVINGVYTLTNHFYIKGYIIIDNKVVHVLYYKKEIEKYINDNLQFITLAQNNYLECKRYEKIVSDLLKDYKHKYCYYTFNHVWIVNDNKITINMFENNFVINNELFTFENALLFLKELLKNTEENIIEIDFNDFCSDFNDKFKLTNMNIKNNVINNNVSNELINSFDKMNIECNDTLKENSNLFIPLSKEDRLYYQSCKKVDIYEQFLTL